jgi:hypothetical protein
MAATMKGINTGASNDSNSRSARPTPSQMMIVFAHWKKKMAFSDLQALNNCVLLRIAQI